MSYYDNKDSRVVLERVLRNFGWKIYGYKEDQSDSMTDYFSPADWYGLAVKNGFILVVDNSTGGKIGGSFVRNSYDHKLLKRVSKLEALRDCPTASIGEKQNAQAMIDKIFGKATITEVVESGLEEITYQKNPKNTYWHIEKNGQILAKGNGVFVFSDLYYDFWRYNADGDKTTFYYTKTEQLNYDAGYWKGEKVRDTRHGLPWDERYLFEDWKKSAITERDRKSKLYDKLFKLIEKWDSTTVIKLGDEDGERLVKRLVTRVEKYYIAEPSETPTDYCKLNEGWKRGDISQYDVFKIENDGKNIRKLTRDWIDFGGEEKSVRTYSLEPRKSTKPRCNTFKADDYILQPKKKTPVAIYVKLVEKLKTYTEEVWVKEKINSPKEKTSNSKPNNTESVKKIPESTSCNFEEILKRGELKDFERTDGKGIEKLVKIKEDINFPEFAKFMKENKYGYWSKIARGFILFENGKEFFGLNKETEDVNIPVPQTEDTNTIQYQQSLFDFSNNTDTVQNKRDLRKEVEVWLTKVFQFIGMDKRDRFESIFDFIIEDVKASADEDEFHEGDFGIAFGRFLDSKAAELVAA